MTDIRSWPKPAFITGIGNSDLMALEQMSQRLLHIRALLDMDFEPMDAGKDASFVRSDGARLHMSGKASILYHDGNRILTGVTIPAPKQVERTIANAREMLTAAASAITAPLKYMPIHMNHIESASHTDNAEGRDWLKAVQRAAILFAGTASQGKYESWAEISLKAPCMGMPGSITLSDKKKNIPIFHPDVETALLDGIVNMANPKITDGRNLQIAPEEIKMRVLDPSTTSPIDIIGAHKGLPERDDILRPAFR